MAEASCSGSTPLKGLVDHQNRDGGLVRDRARASLTPANSFRSQQTAPTNQDGFSAFLQNERLPGSEVLSRFHRPTSSHPSPHLQQQPRASVLNGQASIIASGTGPAASSWVAEYASPTVSHDQAIYANSNMSLAPAGFSPARQFISPPAFYDIQGLGRTAAGLGAPSDVLHSMETRAPAEMLLGDVDEALKQIAEELESSTALEHSTKDEISRPVSIERDTNQSVENSRNLLDDTLVVPENRTVEDGNGKSSDVSEIARRILETVNHEDGIKWRESSFLALMRDFRDGKKVIVKDTILESERK